MEEESDDEVISDTVFGKNVNEVDNADDSVHKETSYDPFKIYDLLHKHPKAVKTDGTKSSLQYPPGFTPEEVTPIQKSHNLQEGHDHSIDKSVGCSLRIPESAQKVDVQLSSMSHVSLKRPLWSYLTFLINCWNVESILMGDFNEVKRKEDRWGTVFNVYGARVFNQFISSTGLVEIQLEGYNYTWAHPSASKMSKLDRFLVSDGLLSSFPHLSAVCLDRHLSDHRPILLREVCIDYGATLFRLFHSWFEYQGFDAMVTNTWNSIILYDKNGMIRFKKKLQILKKEMRTWISDHKNSQTRNVHSLKSQLRDINKALDQGVVNDDLLVTRTEVMKQLHEFQTNEAREYMQKAKIQWVVEGDENSKLFHGIVNRKRANLAVKGVIQDGEWVDEHTRVKDVFRDHFDSRFNEPGPRHGYISHIFPNRLSADQSDDLEKPITRDEIRSAV
uniref:RNA-directed DNA polymerase, eukaryota n=1 Tax=Tanacetum cinerariifolium TaxID=118510 RepID=A0A699GV71_TANCI|nr:RNA-directed DNA polymerase, eukaryota [Tanacetum cinerariifolium]